MGNNLHKETDKKTTDPIPLAYAWLGQQEYGKFLTRMQQHTRAISIKQGSEQVWFCEHLPVYTTGKRAINNSLLPLSAPLVITDRGGETTFHGTGQLMMYPMLQLKRYKLSVRDYVHLLEESCIHLLERYGISAVRDCGLPGVWIGQRKIAALGIRVSQGITSHGIALNVSTDLTWFDHINPCGTSRKTTSMQGQGVNQLNLEALSREWFDIFSTILSRARLAEYAE